MSDEGRQARECVDKTPTQRQLAMAAAGSTWRFPAPTTLRTPSLRFARRGAGCLASVTASVIRGCGRAHLIVTAAVEEAEERAVLVGGEVDVQCTQTCGGPAGTGTGDAH